MQLDGMTSPLLEPARAPSPADPPDAGVAAHYGDPFREQRAPRRRRRRSSTCRTAPVVRVSGPDRLTWLHSLTSQHLEHAGARRRRPRRWSSAARPRRARAVPRRRRRGHLGARRAGHGRGAWSATSTRCGSGRRSRSRTSPRRTPSSLTARRPSTARRLARRRTVPSRSCRARTSSRRRRPRAGGRLGATRRCASPPAGRGSGLETDHRTIPHELGWIETAVHLDKGCYRGQETVARVHNLGRPPRRLVLLHLDGSSTRCCRRTATPSSSTDRHGRRGHRSARHHELGPIALALVKRSTPGRRDPARRRRRRGPGGHRPGLSRLTSRGRRSPGRR